MSETLQLALLLIPCLVIAIVFHEVAHGWAALALGDPTAKERRRLTLNPIRHVDPVGTLLVPGALALFGGPVFGWAKPVPVNFANLRHPKRDMLWVAAAGPFSNLVMALLWALAVKIGIAAPDSYFALPLALMGAAGVFINAIIMVLNLLPLPPLDGGRILVSLLPHRLAYNVSRIEPYGFIILIVLLFSGVLGMILWPVIGMVMTLAAAMIGLPVTDLLRLANVL